MARNLKTISTNFDSLTIRDFDDGNGVQRLYELCDELLLVNKPAACAPMLFRTMERLDDADLGSPGPIVHALESWQGNYEVMLAESVQRKPVLISVWMVNRILNSDPPDAHRWLNLLRSVVKHPLASKETKTLAKEFIQYQVDERDDNLSA